VAEPEPAAALPGPAARRRSLRNAIAAAAVVAVSALGLLLLPALGSHAKGARKLAAIEITGPIAPKPIAAAAAAVPALAPSPTPAAAPTPVPAAEAPPAPVPSIPEPLAAPEPAAAGPEPAAAAPEPSTLPVEAVPERSAATGVPAVSGRGLSREATLAQAKASVRKAEGYVRDGRLGMAEAAYLKALSLFPRYPLAIGGLTRIHLQRHDAGEALRWAKMLVASQPNRGANQRMLGDAYALAGKQADATRAWEQALRYGDRSARQRLGK
jgi:tetratricopeptide (TPR) repeat protein